MADNDAEPVPITVDEALLEVQAATDDLFEYRDHYFDENAIENAGNKNGDVKKRLDRTLKVMEQYQSLLVSSPKFAMLKGKALNVLPDFNSEAQECLTKAIKSDPKLVEAWNQLGECFWKKGDIEAARNAFQGALKHSKNKTSLRNLSMVLRQFGADETEKVKFISESVEKAKEAVQLDVKDGTSWFILGNAYLSLFFNGKQDPSVLTHCMKAYGQADKDSVAVRNPDLHFNRAVALKHREEFQASLEGIQLATALDPSWDMAQQKEQDLLDYLQKTSALVDTKGHLIQKPKKIAQYLGKLSQSHLGAYGGGSYTGSTGQTVPLVQTPLKHLTAGVNREKVVLGKVIGTVVGSDPVVFTFVLIDKEETCYAVTVYNIGPGFGFNVGDSVAIPEPFLLSTTVNHNGISVSYPSIRVETPLILVVNGRKLGLDKQAPSMLTSQACSE